MYLDILYGCIGSLFTFCVLHTVFPKVDVRGITPPTQNNKLPDAVSVETDTVGVYAHLWKMTQGRPPAS